MAATKTVPNTGNAKAGIGSTKTGNQPGARPIPQAAPKINPVLLRRTKPQVEQKPKAEPLSVSAGAVDKVIDLAFNPSRDKIKEVTVIDRIQGRLFPQLDMIIVGREYCQQLAQYRLDRDEYARIYEQVKPVSPNLAENLLHFIAQWQKSVAGKNLERAIDIALAETETKAGEEDDGSSAADVAWKE